MTLESSIGYIYHYLPLFDVISFSFISRNFNEEADSVAKSALSLIYQKLEKFGIVARDTIGRYYCMGLKRANEIIGTTTEELVLKAKQGVTPS